MPGDESTSRARLRHAIQPGEEFIPCPDISSEHIVPLPWLSTDPHYGVVSPHSLSLFPSAQKPAASG